MSQVDVKKIHLNLNTKNNCILVSDFMESACVLEGLVIK